MKYAWAMMLCGTIAVAVAAQEGESGPSAEVLDMDVAAFLAQESDAIQEGARILFEAEAFAKLDAIAAQARETREMCKDGYWKLLRMYGGISDIYHERKEQDRRRVRERAERWMAIAPASPTARAILLEIYTAEAWAARGNDWASKVTEEGWTGFHEWLGKAQVLWNESRNLDEQDPELFSAAITICTGLSSSRADTEAIFSEGIGFAPTYLNLYRSMLMYYLPRWHGSRGDILWLAERSAAETAESQGDALYFFLAVEATKWEGNEQGEEEVLEEFGFSWERVRDGYRDFRRFYGDSDYYANLTAFWACRYDDRRAAREFFNITGGDGYPSLWSDTAFERWGRWAEGKGPRLDEQILHRAARHHDSAVIEKQLEKGAKPNTLDPRGQTPLEVALHEKDWDSALILLEHGANPNAPRFHARTFLSYAIWFAPIHVVQAILDAGADVNADYQQWTPPAYAVNNDRVDVLRVLLAHPECDPNRVVQGGWTPLAAAAADNQAEAVQALTECPRVDVNHPNDRGETPLGMAAKAGHTEVVRALLTRDDCDVNLPNKKGYAPLHLAAMRGRTEEAKLLVEHGAVVDARESRGLTPFLLAAREGHVESARCLLEHGADIKAVTTKGETAIALAQEEGQGEMVTFLKEQGLEE